MNKNDIQIGQKEGRDVLPRNEGEKRKRGRPRKIPKVVNGLEIQGNVNIVKCVDVKQKKDIDSGSCITCEYSNSHVVSDDWSPGSGLNEVKIVDDLPQAKLSEGGNPNGDERNDRPHESMQNKTNRDVQRDKAFRQNTAQKPQYNNLRRKLQSTVRIGAFSLGGLRNLNFLQRKDLLNEFSASIADETNPIFIDGYL
ncbi:MAG: hypothetical protein LBI37_01000 [Puniceicoccales bacterium]|jgi:hypothetical protein|nr:hypothetical protein [Puniceicoccales bacterium]